jgi:flagellin
MLQTAEGALDEVGNMLVRMKDLATQASDASSSDDDKTAMQSEFDNLGKEIQNIMSNTKFGGQALLQGGTLSKKITFQIGADSSEKMSLDLSAELGSGGTVLSALSSASGYAGSASATATAGTELNATNANASINLISSAIDKISTVRSSLGATANRLDHVYNNLQNITSNTKAATGRIMDVDFATESADMTSNQMLLQASTAMLKQTNSMSSMVMSLLQ